jgi:hypothetical protein
MLKFFFVTFLKNVDEKILTTVQKIINKKNKKSQSVWILGDLNRLSRLFWASWVL